MSSDRGYETFPGSGATRVALDAPIRIRQPVPWDKAPTANQLAHALQLHIAEGADANLSGEVQWLGNDTLWFQPQRSFKPLTRYQVILAPWLTGGLTGSPVSYEFTTGETRDKAPPQLSIDDQSVAINTSLAPSDCDLPTGTYLVDMALLLSHDGSHPADDADDGSVEYVAYLSRANGLAAPRFLARTRRAGQTDDPSLHFFLTPEEAQAAVCVVLHAYDGVLRQAKTESEICFDPVDAAYFHGMCSLSLPQTRSSDRQQGRLSIFLIALVLVLRRSMGRPARPR